MVQCDECQRWQHCACVVYEPSSRFYCNKCVGFVSEAPAPARGTLIICPASILAQWREEIRKHTAPGALQVVVYKSVRDKGRLTHPRKLLAAGAKSHTASHTYIHVHTQRNTTLEATYTSFHSLAHTHTKSF